MTSRKKKDYTKLLSITECDICHLELSDPRRIECGHIFCLHCLGKHLRYTASCPTCKRHMKPELGKVENYPVATEIVHLLQSLQKVASCSNILDAEENKVEDDVTDENEYQYAEVDADQYQSVVSNELCDIHGQKLVSVCVTCDNELICAKCSIHSTHDKQEISEHIMHLERLLDQQKTDLLQRQKDDEAEEEKLQDMIEKQVEQKETIKDEIEDIAEGMFAQIHMKKEEMLQPIEKKADEYVKHLTERQEHIKDRKSEFHHISSKIGNLQNDDPTDYCRKAKRLGKQANIALRVENKPVPQYQTIEFTRNERVLEDLLKLQLGDVKIEEVSIAQDDEYHTSDFDSFEEEAAPARPKPEKTENQNEQMGPYYNLPPRPRPRPPLPPRPQKQTKIPQPAKEEPIYERTDEPDDTLYDDAITIQNVGMKPAEESDDNQECLIPAEENDDNQECLIPAEESDDNQECLIPAEENDDNQECLIPAEENDDNQECLIPAEENDDNQECLIPAEENDDNQECLIPAEENDDNQECLIPAEENDDNQECLIPAEENDDNQECLIPAEESDDNQECLIPAEENDDNQECLIPAEESDDNQECLIPAEENDDNQECLIPAEENDDNQECLIPAEESDDNQECLIPAEENDDNQECLIPAEENDDNQECLIPAEENDDNQECLIPAEEKDINQERHCNPPPLSPFSGTFRQSVSIAIDNRAFPQRLFHRVFLPFRLSGFTVVQGSLGNYYTFVTDDRNVKMFKQNGEFYRTITDLIQPFDVASQQHGVSLTRLYITDEGRRMGDGSVRVYTSEGEFLKVLVGRLRKPQGISLSRVGLVYVCDEASILVFCPKTGKKKRIISTIGKDPIFVRPMYVMVSATGKLLVSDVGTRELKIHDETRKYTDKFKPDENEGELYTSFTPGMCSEDSSSNYYVIDQERNMLYMLRGGGRSEKLELPQKPKGHDGIPTAVSFDTDTGNIVVF